MKVKEIVCPNCNHPNPEGANQCEACYTPLPATTNCPSCGSAVQADATFCGQCGFNLHPTVSTNKPETLVVGASAIPPTVVSSAMPNPGLPVPPMESEPVVNTVVAAPNLEKSNVNIPATVVAGLEVPVSQSVAQVVPPTSPPTVVPVTGAAKTQLQQQTLRLIHIQSNTPIELLANLSVIHIGKPNDLVPPDIDVSGFPNSEVVSRTHADIRVEGDAYYIEDVGSSNGTYINNTPLLKGNRHRLRPGDRIALGKGDLVSFLFQLS
ncbi:phosphopeptide-binding protein [Oscillatoriales cyanobacterium USR001]|nr:phosphopeptide-binding protein [Oscillatoriales cyanobacterium USR001]